MSEIAKEIGDDESRVRNWFARKRSHIKKESEPLSDLSPLMTFSGALKRKDDDSSLQDQRHVLLKRARLVNETENPEILRSEFHHTLQELSAEYERRAVLEAEIKRLREENEFLQRAATLKRDQEKTQAAAIAKSTISDIKRSVKNQLEYKGSYKISLQIPNIPLDAYQIIVGEPSSTSYSLCLSEHQFAELFDCPNNSCYTKTLRYGGVLTPKWPLHMQYNPQKNLIKISGMYAMQN